MTLPTLTPLQADLLGGGLGFIFTIALLSYLVGDNPLYRAALHIFIGVAAGYAALVVIYQVIAPRLVSPLLSGNLMVVALAVVPFVLFILLALRLSPGTALLGSISAAYLVGVGAAVAMGGALTGTITGQVQATWLAPGGNLLNNVIILIGTVTTLLYFQFWVRGRTVTGEDERPALLQGIVNVGQVFLVVTLGAVYGGMILSGLAVFSQRLLAIANWLARVF
ncbi:MAG: hypothetical protein IT326_03520 [Anaerolineae bacterium]|nr:hypothetical protein [Anaerolineae bacterium]